MNEQPIPRPAATGSGRDLTALLKRQRDLYVQLGRLAEGQRSMITGDEPERLLGILAERQQLIDQLEAVGRRLKPYQANWRQIRGSLASEQAGEVDALVSEVNALLSGILKNDEADAQLLSIRKSQTAQAAGEIKAARQAGSAYAASAGAPRSGSDWGDA